MTFAKHEALPLVAVAHTRCACRAPAVPASYGDAVAPEIVADSPAIASVAAPNTDTMVRFIKSYS